MMEQVQTIRRGILDDQGVSNLLDGLSFKPDRIRDSRDNLAAAEHELRMHEINELEQAKDALIQVELEVAFEVRAGGNHKNEEARKAAIAVERAKNPDYVAAVNRLANAKRKKAELENNATKNRNSLFFILDEFKGLVAIAGVVQGLCHEHENGQLLTDLTYQKNKLATIFNQLKEEISDV